MKLLSLMLNHDQLGKQPIMKGQRVKLTTVGGRKATTDNPVVGSRFECEGTTELVADGGFGKKTHVAWDNGVKNSYRLKEVVVSDLPCNPHPYHFKTKFGKNNPNYTWKLRKTSPTYAAKYILSKDPGLTADQILATRGNTWL